MADVLLEPKEIALEFARMGHTNGGNGTHNGNGTGGTLSLRELFGDVPGITRPMSYEEYMQMPEEMARYDIIDGWKMYYTWGEQKLPNQTGEHQQIVLNVIESFRIYQKRAKSGRTIIAPRDVLVHRNPKLHTRQPDVSFISSQRWNQNAFPLSAEPLTPAPELVVEIFSRSDRRELTDKIADYRQVDVQECWIVRPADTTVESLVLTPDAEKSLGIFSVGEIVESRAFPNLAVPVADVFAELSESEE